MNNDVPELNDLSADSTPIPKYPHPKILLMDMGAEVELALQQAGYNATSGTFGPVYQVAPDGGLEFITSEGKAPGIYEQEIVFVNLLFPESQEAPDTEEPTIVPHCRIARVKDYVDTRIMTMLQLKEHFETIVSYGGIIVVFTDSRVQHSVLHGAVRRGYFEDKARWLLSDWDFHSWLGHDNIDVRNNSGAEMFFLEEFKAQLPRHSNDCYQCSFVQRKTIFGAKWTTLGVNKYNEPIAVVLETSGRGKLFLLPQFGDKVKFVLHWLQSYLPEITPELFPSIEKGKWTHQSPYELPKIVELQERLDRVIAEATSHIATIEQEIEQERSNEEYQYDLLSATGTPLVDAVKRALEELGFADIVDHDAYMSENKIEGDAREDLQIFATSPTLLVEIKGVAGHPSEAESLAVAKYVAPRMRQWERIDVQGLTIINAHRHIPALDRDPNPYSQNIVVPAEKDKIGLMTSWDLFRILRGAKKHGWTFDQVRPIFYRSGRIEPIPDHYTQIGIVFHFYDQAQAVSVEVTAGELRLGDRIAFESTVGFDEEEITSLQVDRNDVEMATVGQRAGIKTGLTKAQLRANVRVFKVEPSGKEQGERTS